jgi:hypothetical protein
MPLITTQYSRLTGLGNKLFPWALAKIFAHENNFRMLKQNWISIRGAAVVRGGIDYSTFLGKIYLFNNFHNTSFEDSNFLRIFKNKYYVNSIKEANSYKKYDAVILFNAFAEHTFREMYGHQKFLLDELIKITNKSSLKMLENLPNRYVALNIRSGNDFANSNAKNVVYKKTDIDWFVSSLKKIRKEHPTLPAIIVSDADSSIKTFFSAFENIINFHSKTAICDLLVLSKSSLILGSGASSFSAWGAFLSASPYYSSEDTPFDKFHLPDPYNHKIKVKHLK